LIQEDAYFSPRVASVILNQMCPKKKRQFLNKREQEVLQGLANGDSYKLLADSLHISIHTVRHHIRNLYRKLKVHSKAEAIKKYYTDFLDI